MDRDKDGKIADQKELGTLARESESIRLKRRNEEAGVLPAMIVAADDGVPSSGEATAAAGGGPHNVDKAPTFADVWGRKSSKVNTAVGGGWHQASEMPGAGKDKHQRVNSLPGGSLFIVALLVVCICGRNIELVRNCCLANLSLACGSLVDQNSSWLMQNAYAECQEKCGQFDGAIQTYKLMIAACTNPGSDDESLVGAKLKLARAYLRRGQAQDAHSLVSACLPLLKNPHFSFQKVPGITATLQDLARVSASNDDLGMTQILYNAALNAWPYQQGAGTVSNWEQDLAEILEQHGNWSAANNLWHAAYEYGESKGWRGGWTVNRLYHMGLNYNRMGMPDKAKDYLQQASDKAKLLSSPWWNYNIAGELNTANQALSNSALPDPSSNIVSGSKSGGQK